MGGAEPNRGACESLVTLLADRRRRLVWAHVTTAAEDVFTLDELAEQVAAWEREQRDGSEPAGLPAPDDRHQRVAVDLHHRHLPRLADVGIVEYDARSRTVRQRMTTIGDDEDDLVERVLAAEASRLPTRDR